jgi:hypothetical protein
MEPEDSLSCSTASYFQPDESNLHPHILFIWYILTLSYYLRQVSHIPSLLIFWLEFCT